MKSLLQLRVNGETHTVAAHEHWSLLEVLRYELGLTGSKQGCDKGDCGACTVLRDGEAVLACCTLAAACAAASTVNPTARPTERESTTRTAPSYLSATTRAALQVLESLRDMCTATTPSPLDSVSALANAASKSAGVAPAVVTPGVATRLGGISSMFSRKSVPSNATCSGTCPIP